ncbi:UDP-3-O-(3-hydroxymyristoyl)glucosamine N-acyltransferase [Pseudoalteromonas sp. MTN2-4]|uniref:UDP-3-O-(3-hydroxymyristoyl)glucosamine N-acyltransferase n=1 Tax=Pseudoalteromonas sp. MTN2-4 TaxID=3056555 RepID=UPI0036F34847
MTKQYTLAQISEFLDASLDGDASHCIEKIATLANAKETDIAFLANKKYRAQLDETQAGAVIISEKEAALFSGNKVIVKDAYIAYAKLAQMMDTTPVCANGIHPSAVIDENAQIGENVSVAANAVISAGVVLGDNVQIGAGCFVGENTKIGQGTKLWANVSVYHDIEIGEYCLFQSGAVIGSDGFGYANEAGKWVKIPQLGRVIIGDRVEIGASTTIDRGALDDTIIHDDVILDNQIQIAHNVEIGQGSAMAACSVIAGSTTVGKYCQIAGLVGINGHIDICDGVMLTGMTMVTKSITEPGAYSSGMPHTTNKEWRRNMAHFRNLSDFKERIKVLETRSPQKTVDE